MVCLVNAVYMTTYRDNSRVLLCDHFGPIRDAVSICDSQIDEVQMQLIKSKQGPAHSRLVFMSTHNLLQEVTLSSSLEVSSGSAMWLPPPPAMMAA